MRMMSTWHVRAVQYTGTARRWRLPESLCPPAPGRMITRFAVRGNSRDAQYSGCAPRGP